MNKLKFLSWFALTVFSATAWAAVTQGPWTYMDYRTGCCDRTANAAISFDGLNNSHWAEVTGPWCDGDGVGFTVKNGKANSNSKNGVYSTYYIDQTLESYSRKVLTWTFQIGSKSKKHYSNTCLYGLQGTWQQINALTVDFTEDYSNKTGSGNLLAQYRNTTLSGSGVFTSNYTKTFSFDNRNNASSTTKSWCLLLTHVVSSVDPVDDISEWGSFKHVSATWTTYYYKYVTFNGNGSTSGSMSQQTIENSGKLTANAFSRTGYTFDGWATSSTGSKAYDNQGDISATSGSKGNVPLYARWTANKYTVSFNQQSGSGGSGNITATYDANMPTVSVPTRAGYTFQGYFDAASGGTKYYNANGTSARTWNKASNATLYAQWSIVTYTISYDLKGGTVTGNPANYNIETATFTLNNPTRAGYTFAGWTGSNGNTPQTSVQIAKGSTGNKTYTANWNPITYTITYDLAGGQGTNPATYTIETPTFQLAVTRLGYTFLGWTGSNGNTPQTAVQIAKGSTGDKNYVAHWAINPNTNVVYLDSLDNTAAQETVAFNRPEAPEVAGFTFVRWDVVESPLSEGITLQAIYAENQPSGAPKKQVGKFTLTRKEGAENEYILQTAK